MWPLIDQMNPSADVLALASIEIDIASIQPGQSVTFTWRSHPLFVRRRTPAEIEAARSVAVDDLLDPVARNANLPENAPATDENRLSPNVGGQQPARPSAAGMACRARHLHASRLHAGGQHPASPKGRLWRLALPLPWFAVRHRGTGARRTCAAQSRRAAIPVPVRHPHQSRLRKTTCPVPRPISRKQA